VLKTRIRNPFYVGGKRLESPSVNLLFFGANCWRQIGIIIALYITMKEILLKVSFHALTVCHPV
jgi:hypothetical protein